MAELSSLGKYEIRRELGRGAMGVVYEGYDPMIKRIVALKTIRADQLAGENAETVVARFRREAQAAGRLNHPNIVAIYDFGEEQGVWYIAMEFIKGRELKDYFQANERFAPAVESPPTPNPKSRAGVSATIIRRVSASGIHECSHCTHWR